MRRLMVLGVLAGWLGAVSLFGGDAHARYGMGSIMLPNSSDGRYYNTHSIHFDYVFNTRRLFEGMEYGFTAFEEGDDIPTLFDFSGHEVLQPFPFLMGKGVLGVATQSGELGYTVGFLGEVFVGKVVKIGFGLQRFEVLRPYHYYHLNISVRIK